MLFLASWHGLYIGYYLTFLFEYLLLFAELMVNMLIARLFPRGIGAIPLPLRWFGYFIFSVLVITSWSTALVPFFFLTWERILPVWNTIGHAGIVGTIIFMVVTKALLVVIPPRRVIAQKLEEKKSY
jgi:hypothetical protein